MGSEKLQSAKCLGGTSSVPFFPVSGPFGQIGWRYGEKRNQRPHADLPDMYVLLLLAFHCWNSCPRPTFSSQYAGGKPLSHLADAVTVQSGIDRDTPERPNFGYGGSRYQSERLKCGRSLALRLQDKTSCHTLYSWAVVRGQRVGSFRNSNATTSTKYYRCRSGRAGAVALIFAVYSPVSGNMERNSIRS